MNPQLHEEFVALCALYHSGEISDEEWALLQVHLAYCDSCRTTFDQYTQVVDNVAPVIAAAAAEATSVPHESDTSLHEAEKRLMERLESISSPPPAPAKKPTWHVLAGAVAAAAALSTMLTWNLARHKTNPTLSASPSSNQTISPSTTTASNGGESIALRESQDEIAKLRQQVTTLETQSHQADPATTTLQHQLQAEQAQREQIASERDALGKQLAVVQTEMQALREKVTSSESNTDQQNARVASLETKVRSMNVALEEANSALNDRERMLALDKDFLAHDRDIRDLIGARDLYIADIYDTNENGKTSKPFGRLFYTRDRSLAFYGFDLDKQPGLKQAATFQAWGAGSDRQPVSLGLFYQDDSHKRWVVRFNDAKTLSRLNMVFVTVEPPGGSSKPTGKQLLRAYLQIQPNHP